MENTVLNHVPGSQDSPDDDILTLRLLRQGKIRAALDRAKSVHKSQGSRSTEALLLRCYAMRVKELRAAGHKAEADALETFVEKTFPNGLSAFTAELPPPKPESKPTLAESKAEPGMSDALGEALALLADSGISDEDRRNAETCVAELAFDPVGLAKHPSMTPGHPLAAQAKAVAEAFSAVVSRPVGELELSLPAISHRSPLAGWKLMLRAIGHFQRGEDEKAGQALYGVARRNCAPAQLVPLLRALLVGDWEKLDSVSKRIFARWRPREKRLPAALARLDSFFFQVRPRGRLRNCHGEGCAKA